ncbi:lysophospholipid acyltransferase family protein [Methylogaea oryzae]|uniref:Lysophosphatidic acid acyltransferase n=1 Tax=Methylogaea oryzae TaxID=1295382 RepID=A0A8D5AIU8_9GAMM|nr:lysophospholipid acyltransferase family protein [Methylogaea oryzae]BBL71741.1 lysophosphatidic acid acyltransferase [Methylogaea oryzae]
MTPSSTSSPKPRLGLILRSAAFFAVMCLITLVIGPVMVLRRKAPFAVRYGLAQYWVRSVLAALEKICGLRYEVHGVEHIPPQNGVILSKHQSAWETIALQAIFPPMAFVLKRELLKIPVWGWAMDTCEPIAIDRGAKSAALKQLLQQGEHRLNQGRWVVLFPEGTRVPPGQKGKYAGSGGMLAQRAGCPVVPVAHNAGEFWPRNGFLKRPGVIQVRIGPPIDTTRHKAQEIVDLAEHWIEAQMAEISQARQP